MPAFLLGIIWCRLGCAFPLGSNILSDWRLPFLEKTQEKEKLLRQSKKFDSFSDLGLKQLLIPILLSSLCIVKVRVSETPKKCLSLSVSFSIHISNEAFDLINAANEGERNSPSNTVDTFTNTILINGFLGVATFYGQPKCK